MASVKPRNIIVAPDLTGFAPPDSAWSAVDGDEYDGPGSPVGFGPTPEDARADLLEILEARS